MSLEPGRPMIDGKVIVGRAKDDQSVTDREARLIVVLRTLQAAHGITGNNFYRTLTRDLDSGQGHGEEGPLWTILCVLTGVGSLSLPRFNKTPLALGTGDWAYIVSGVYWEITAVGSLKVAMASIRGA